MRVFQSELCVSAIYKAMTSTSPNSSLPGEDRKPTVLYHTAAISYCLYIHYNTCAKQHATHKLNILLIIYK